MYDVGFIERYGAGIRMMKRLSAEWGNKEPRYEFHPLQTIIIFDSPIQESTFIEIDDISEQLNERQIRIRIGTSTSSSSYTVHTELKNTNRKPLKSA